MGLSIPGRYRRPDPRMDHRTKWTTGPLDQLDHGPNGPRSNWTTVRHSPPVPAWSIPQRTGPRSIDTGTWSIRSAHPLSTGSTGPRNRTMVQTGPRMDHRIMVHPIAGGPGHGRSTQADGPAVGACVSPGAAVADEGSRGNHPRPAIGTRPHDPRAGTPPNPEAETTIRNQTWKKPSIRNRSRRPKTIQKTNEGKTNEDQKRHQKDTKEQDDPKRKDPHRNGEGTMTTGLRTATDETRKKENPTQKKPQTQQPRTSCTHPLRGGLRPYCRAGR